MPPGMVKTPTSQQMIFKILFRISYPTKRPAQWGARPAIERQYSDRGEDSRLPGPGKSSMATWTEPVMETYPEALEFLISFVSFL